MSVHKIRFINESAYLARLFFRFVIYMIINITQKLLNQRFMHVPNISIIEF